MRRRTFLKDFSFLGIASITSSMGLLASNIAFAGETVQFGTTPSGQLAMEM